MLGGQHYYAAKRATFPHMFLSFSTLFGGVEKGGICHFVALAILYQLRDNCIFFISSLRDQILFAFFFYLLFYDLLMKLHCKKGIVR